jgi:hypothetical protein
MKPPGRNQSGCNSPPESVYTEYPDRH